MQTAALVSVSAAMVAVVVVSAALGQPAAASTNTVPGESGAPPENAAILLYVRDGVNGTDLDAILASLPAGVHVSAVQVSPSELARALGAVGGNATVVAVLGPTLVDVARALGAVGGNATAPAPYNGTVGYSYGPNPKPGLNYPAGQWLQDIRFLETQAELLNSMFRMPYNLTILAQECGEPNAFYGGSVIILCYEKIDYNWNLWNSARYNELYRPDMPTCPDPESEPETVCPYPKEILTSTPESVFAPGERTDYLYHTLLDTLYHEMGHAVLDMYRVPYTGSMENVADQFSAYMFAFRGAEGQRMMRDVSTLYGDMVGVGKEYPGHVVHPLNEQRHYNYMCWAFGLDPDANSDLLEGSRLPGDRAVWCPYQIHAIQRAFDGILADHIRDRN